MKIAVTGDMHRDIFFTTIRKAIKYGITHLIVCGDFGYIWYGDEIIKEETFSPSDTHLLNKLSELNIEVLFCDGNHENFYALERYKIEERYGGKVHKIRDNVYHLMRGEVYEINGDKYFVFGGARSIDKECRIENVTWWKNEEATFEEWLNGYNNLKKHKDIDYVITHTCPSEILEDFMKEYKTDQTTKMLDFFKDNMLNNFRHWYFGHLHQDYDSIDKKFCCLYHGMKFIEDNKWIWEVDYEQKYLQKGNI